MRRVNLSNYRFRKGEHMSDQLRKKTSRGARLFPLLFALALLFSLIGLQPTREAQAQSGLTADYQWTAFNDCMVAGPSGTTNPANTTTLNCSVNGSATLTNFSTCAGLGITMTVAISGQVDEQTTNTLWGEEPAAGTDAYNLFFGNASIYGGMRLYGASSKVTLTISGLTAGKTYTFATTANRGNSGSDYINRMT